MAVGEEGIGKQWIQRGYLLQDRAPAGAQVRPSLECATGKLLLISQGDERSGDPHPSLTTKYLTSLHSPKGPFFPERHLMSSKWPAFPALLLTKLIAKFPDSDWRDDLVSHRAFRVRTRAIFNVCFNARLLPVCLLSFYLRFNTKPKRKLSPPQCCVPR